MYHPAPTQDEALRMMQLAPLQILDTVPEAAFDRLTRLAALVMDAPMALVVLMDGPRQWFKSRVGIDPAEAPRSWAICNHEAPGDAPFVVADAAADPRFADHPLVVGAPFVRFYAGAPLRSPDGERLGTLCVLDSAPRAAPDAAQLALLTDLASLVVDETELRRATARAQEAVRLEQKLNQRLEDAHRGLLAAYQSKSAFLASLSHELRTPLNAVIGYADLIADPAYDPGRHREHAAEIAQAGRHILLLVNDILEFSRLEAGGVRLTRSAVPLRRPIEEALRMVGAFARARAVSLAGHIACAEAFVDGDEIRLKQVLLNLLTNAVKFTPAGGSVQVRLTRAATAADPGGEAGEALIEVADTGIGIDPADIAKALTPFGQIVPASGPRQDGTGLGLPIARALVERHGGTMTIDSAPGRGTSVLIRLPAIAGPAGGS